MLIVDGFIQRAISRARRPAPAGDGAQGLHLPRLQGRRRAGQVAQRLRQPADPRRPGEFQIWELGNLGADAFFDLKLEGHDLWVIERDGNLLLKPVRVDHVFLPPGARATVVVKAGAGRRVCAGASLNVDTGPAGDPNPDVTARHLHRRGQAGGGRPAILARLREGPRRPEPDPAQPDTVAQAARIDRTRYIDFSESANGNTFFINNKTYKENRVDTTTRVGQVERWIVRNFSQELHVFHLHQTEFLITKFSGTPDQTLGGGLRDVINIPYAKNGKPGVAEVIIPFTNPIIVGEFVYHCHIVQHEDAGMMANIRVLPQADPGRGALGQGHPAGRPRPAAALAQSRRRCCWPSSTPRSAAAARRRAVGRGARVPGSQPPRRARDEPVAARHPGPMSYQPPGKRAPARLELDAVEAVGEREAMPLMLRAAERAQQHARPAQAGQQSGPLRRPA